MKNFTPKIYLSSILCLLFSFISIGQKATISGIVTEKESGEPLISATISAGGIGVVSDFNGQYTLDLPAGKHWLEFSYIGYETYTTQIELSTGQVLKVDVSLGNSPTILETATVTSGKFEKPLGEVTVSMEVLKPRLIEATNTTALDKVLNKVPGVNIIGGQANIRGGSGWSYGAGSRVMLLVDDLPALQADAGTPQWSDIPIENAEQVEVVKGAASALYGSAALNGIINFRTGYAKNKPITKISTFGKAFLSPKDNTKKWWSDLRHEEGLTILHKQKIKKLDLVVSGFGFRRRGVTKDAFNDYGRITINPRYRINENLSVGFNSNYNKGKSRSYFYWQNASDGAYKGDTTGVSNSKKNRLYIDPFITYYDKSGNRHKFQSRFFSIINDNDGNQSNRSKLYYGEYQFQKKLESMDLVMSAGLVGIRTNISAEIYGDTSYLTTNLASYLQLDKKFGRLNLSAGARYERNKIAGPTNVIIGADTVINQTNDVVEAKPVFRLGANYQIGKATYLRTSWGQGYRFPTIAEKYVSTSAGAINVLPNPNLDSETGWSGEIGVKQGFKLGNWSGFLDVAGFWSEYDNMMEFRLTQIFPRPAFQSVNVGDTQIRGLDISVAGEGNLFGLTTYLLAGYTYLDPTFRDFTDDKRLSSSVDYNILKYRYKHSFKFDIQSTYKKLTLGFSVQANSNMEAIDQILNVIVPDLEQFRETHKGWQKVDIRAAYEVNKNAKLSFIFDNALNEEYMERPGVLLAPRNVTLRLDLNF